MPSRPIHLYLVDGTFELFRCFHGAPRVSSANGREVGAVRGLLFTLVSLLRKKPVTHLAVAFDQMAGGAPSGSPSDGELIRSQYLLATDVVRALGITLWPMYRFQADDALATGAELFRDDPRVEQIVICTTDKDLTQSVSGDRVVLLDRIRDRVMNEDGVVKLLGVPPAKVPEYLALVGDPSDGLPGVPKWGPKSAATVLNRYGRIEEIPEEAAQWDVTVRGAEGLAKSLRERRREAVLMRNLSYRRRDVPIPDSLEDLEWKGADRVRVEELVSEIGGEEVLDRMPRWTDRARSLP